MQEHVNDLIPGYALNCLDEAEANKVAEHLAICELCRDDLRAYQMLVDQLPLASPDAIPSARVKQGLMDRIQAGASKPAPEKLSVWERFGNIFRAASPAWGLASLGLVVVLLVSNLLLWRQYTQLQAAPKSDALQVVNLAGTDIAPDATGMVIISLDGEHGTLVVDRLPSLNPELQYQLWLIKDGERTNGGVFSVGPSGYASLWVGAPIPLGDYDAFGITIEPAGGSPGPTGDKVLGG